MLPQFWTRRGPTLTGCCLSRLVLHAREGHADELDSNMQSPLVWKWTAPPLTSPISKAPTVGLAVKSFSSNYSARLDDDLRNSIVLQSHEEYRGCQAQTMNCTCRYLILHISVPCCCKKLPAFNFKLLIVSSAHKKRDQVAGNLYKGQLSRMIVVSVWSLFLYFLIVTPLR